MRILRSIGGVLMLSGLIIGAGMFALPFSFYHAGFWLGVGELVLLTIVMILVHLSYGDIVLETPTLHRLPGYSRIYLGRVGEFISSLSAFTGMMGILLVYLLLGSRFLAGAVQLSGFSMSFPSGVSSDLFFVFCLVLIGACITYFPIRKEAVINSIFTAIFIGFVLYLIYVLMPFVQSRSLAGISWENGFLPYGILLFSLYGGAVIPDVVTFLQRDRTTTRIAISLGTAIPAILYFFFALVIVGISGEFTSEDALRGLGGRVGDNIIIIGAFIGFFTILDSYIALGKSFQMMLRLDFGLPRIAAWALSIGAPLALYFLGFTDFIFAIALIGTFAIGIDLTLILFIDYKMKRSSGKSFSKISLALRLLLFVVVLGGVWYHLFAL